MRRRRYAWVALLWIAMNCLPPADAADLSRPGSHMVEHENCLVIAFSGAKQTMEAATVSLDDVDALIAKGAAE